MFERFSVYRGLEEAGDDGERLSRDFLLIKKGLVVADALPLMFEKRGLHIAPFHMFGIPGISTYYYTKSEINAFVTAIGSTLMFSEIGRKGYEFVSVHPRGHNYMESVLYKNLVLPLESALQRRIKFSDFLGRFK